MPYKYKPPAAESVLNVRADLVTEFKRWNAQAEETVITDYRLPLAKDSADGVTAVVEFLLRGSLMTVKIDEWNDFRVNLKCCYLNIRDLRLAEARGALNSMRETLAALPAPKTKRSPWDVLGIREGSGVTVAEAAYRDLAQKLHPDKPGGSNEAMAELNDAIASVKAAARS